MAYHPTRGFTVWLTGLSGAGKSTLSRAVHRLLAEKGIMNVEILDGDMVRTTVPEELGFSERDRNINIRRIGWVCQLLTKHGIPNIVACISPYRAMREEVRKKIGDFIEVYVKCPLEVCERRDVKGLYQRARAGEIEGFTGIDGHYEEPIKPDVTVNTEHDSVDLCAKKIVSKLEDLGYIETSVAPYGTHEIDFIQKKMEELGYID